ncbi:MAG TPA: DUF4321 domain-containing protein [Defluviitaleaceae bacterium]|nr:DUF4321 domain-containing protein [Defluviitaleaceae bacterium]
MNIKKGKNNWVLFIFILMGIVIGGFIGHYLGQAPYFEWINFGKEFGFDAPAALDLQIIYIEIAFKIEITIASILGVIAAILIYRKI